MKTAFISSSGIFKYGTGAFILGSGAFIVGVGALILVALALLFSAACGCGIRTGGTYRQVTQEEAVRIMEEQTDYIVLDVRTEEEYDEGHIPGAINIPNEYIGTLQPRQLPDKDQLILVYCRRGNRSKQAAQKLYDQGYTNIVDFGGINTWTGDIVSEDYGDDYAGD